MEELVDLLEVIDNLPNEKKIILVSTVLKVMFKDIKSKEEKRMFEHSVRFLIASILELFDEAEAILLLGLVTNDYLQRHPDIKQKIPRLPEDEYVS